MTARDRLLAAARAVLARDGIEGLTLRAIAREAGVSHGAPLRHFPSLGRLLAALSAEGFDQLVASVATAIEGDVALERVARAGRGYLRFAVAEPGVYSVMFRADLCDVSDPVYQRASAAAFDQLIGLVTHAQAAGWQEGRSATRLAAVLWANVHGLAELWLHGSLRAVVDVDDVERLADDLFGLQGLDSQGDTRGNSRHRGLSRQ